MSGRVEHELRGTARLTWSFFERFVTAEDNHLPPDNFQEDPQPVVAHRTSPTNMGLYLLSTVAARDFGWLGLRATCDRLRATLATMQKLERHRGHFLNWYDTRSQAALLPRYVSTVDSGNLAGHLLTLRQACLEMRHAPLVLPAGIDRGRWMRWTSAAVACWNPTVVKPAASGAANCSRRCPRIRQQLAAETTTLAAAAALLHVAARDIATQVRRTTPRCRARSRAAPKAGQDVDSHLQDLQDLPTTALPCTATPRGAGCGVPRARRGGYAAHGTGEGVRGAGGQHVLRLPLRPQPRPVLHRLPRGRTRNWTAATTTCWPPKRGWRAWSPSRLRRRTVLALVPARPAPHRRLAPSGAGLLVRFDVRVPDAHAGDAGAAAWPAGPDQIAARCASRWNTANAMACHGAFPNPPAMCATGKTPTSIRASACHRWDSSAGWARHGLIVEAITVSADEVQPTDLVRVPDGWGRPGIGAGRVRSSCSVRLPPARRRTSPWRLSSEQQR